MSLKTAFMGILGTRGWLLGAGVGAKMLTDAV